YALGATLCQFLTGDLPFDGPTPMQVLLNVVHQPLAARREIFDPLPREVREAVALMTAKDPNRRLANIPAVMDALKKARDALRTAGMASTAPITGASRSSFPSIKDPVSLASQAAISKTTRKPR